MTQGTDALVSVVTIFRNAEAYLEEAIGSVLSQTHPVELLLCDDGSSDDSTGIAKRWAAAEPSRVRYLAHPAHAHRGMSATRNLGIRAATGQFVAFLDADDVWEPVHLAHEVDLALRYPEAGLVCGQALLWHSWKRDGTPDVWSPPPWPDGTLVRAPRMLTATLRRGAYRTPTCSLLVRRDLLAAVMGAEEEFTSMFEDQALLAKLHTASPSVVSGAPTARYRQHAASTTARAARAGRYEAGEPNPSMERYLRWLEAYLASGRAAIHDAELTAALAVALEPYQRAWRRWRAEARLRTRAALPRGMPALVRDAVRRARSVGPVRWGSLRRLEPVVRVTAPRRDLAIERHYIEQFLSENAPLIAGRVLEVGDAGYTRHLGSDYVTRSDVLEVLAIDLVDGAGLPAAAYDCVVLPQVLQSVSDLPAAVRTLHRVLRTGGTLLATCPGISRLDGDPSTSPRLWGLTPASVARLFGEVFGRQSIEVQSYGNVVLSIASMHGLTIDDLRSSDLRMTDPQYPMLITVRAGVPVEELGHAPIGDAPPP